MIFSSGIHQVWHGFEQFITDFETIEDQFNLRKRHQHQSALPTDHQFQLV